MTDQELQAKVEERQSAAEIIKELQTEVDACSAEIKAELGVRGITKLQTGAWVPQIVIQNRHTINKTKLLSAGVTVQQIAQATETTEVVSLRVLKAGAPDPFQVVT